MAFLYRRDLELLGYDIKLKKIKKKRLLSVLAYADLITDNQTVLCMATFFKLRNGVRVDYIFEENTENQIMDTYISFMKKSPVLFMELLMRTGIKIVSIICGLIACACLGYSLVTSSYSITIIEFSKMLNMIICIILVMVVRTLLNTI